MRHLRTQFGLIAIWLYNCLYNLLPLFTLKNLLLQQTRSIINPKSYVHTPVHFTWIGRLSMGTDSTVNFGCLLDTRHGITIGNHAMIGHSCKIYTQSHDIDNPFFKSRGAPVIISDYAVIFPNTLIMPGVTIERGAVVLPGSVVTRNVPEYEVHGGNPARFIRKRSTDLRYQLDYGFWFINS